jgi:hypothetical protein
LNGFEVIAQVPELHPIKFQYNQPAIAPIMIPIRLPWYFFIKESTILRYLNF